MTSRRSARPRGRAVGRSASRHSTRRPPDSGWRARLPWFIGGLAVVGVAAVAVAAFVVPPSAPPLQSGPPPSNPQITGLKTRLQADGLQVLSQAGAAVHIHQHLDLYVDGDPVTVPANIGIDEVNGFLSPIHTHDTTGIIHVESPVVRDFTLGQFFDVWGVRFDASCVGGECAGGGRSLTVYVNGQLFTGDPRTITLTAHEEIFIAIGTPDQLPNPIPSSYEFPTGL